MSDQERLGFEDYVQLLPERCQKCHFAQMMVGMLLSFESATGGPMSTIGHIHEQCIGYQGEEQLDVQTDLLESDTGDSLIAFFPDHDSMNQCPFHELLN